jgi:hypothetical protein
MKVYLILNRGSISQQTKTKLESVDASQCLYIEQRTIVSLYGNNI